MKARPKIENYKYSDGSGYDDLRHHADIEQWAEEAEQKIEKLKVTTINEIINKVESMKGLAGRMAMGEWSSAMIEMLEGLKEEK